GINCRVLSNPSPKKIGTISLVTPIIPKLTKLLNATTTTIDRFKYLRLSSNLPFATMLVVLGNITVPKEFIKASGIAVSLLALSNRPTSYISVKDPNIILPVILYILIMITGINNRILGIICALTSES